jgi:hypothetical protein
MALPGRADPRQMFKDGPLTPEIPGTLSHLRQWFSVKTMGPELNKVFEHVVDNDGTVETVQYVGGRDWVIFWSKPVTR